MSRRKSVAAAAPGVEEPLAPQLPAPYAYAEAPAVHRAPQLHEIARCRWCLMPFQRMDERHWICSSRTCADRQLEAAIRKAGDTSGPILFLPLPLQIDVDESPITHLLVAGAAGVSKSTSARWNTYRRCRRIAGYRALLLRTSYPELEKNHGQFFAGETKALGDATYKSRVVTFDQPDGNDSKIFSGYCDVRADIPNHLGAEWSEIDFDEAVTFLPEAISEITSRARGTSTCRLSHERLGLRSGRTRLYSNPGGKCMRHLVATYIRRNPDRELFPTYDPSEYGWIGCTLLDNPYLPPEYEKTALSGLSAARYQQLRHGDWTVYAGMFFQNFDEAIHLTDEEPA